MKDEARSTMKVVATWLPIILFLVGVLMLVAMARPQPQLQQMSQGPPIIRGADTTYGNVCYATQQGAIACVHVPGLSPIYSR